MDLKTIHENRGNMDRFQKQLANKKVAVTYFLSGLFESSGFVYRVVFIQLPSTIWYVKAPFIKMMLENVFGGNKVPYWVSSLREIFIRQQPHGPNQLSRTRNAKGCLGYPKSVIAFTHKVSRAASPLERHSLGYAIAKIHNVFANNMNGLHEALHSWSCENQPGVVRYFKDKFDLEALLVKFKKDINKTFKAKRVLNTKVALDRFMLDWDIKKFVKNDIGLNHWPEKDLRYIYKCATRVPDFDTIQEVSTKSGNKW